MMKKQKIPDSTLAEETKLTKLSHLQLGRVPVVLTP